MSLATIDRVLNGRPGVRKTTIERVMAAIESIGYVRDTSAANLARQRQYTFVFVLPEAPSQFVESIGIALREAYASQLADRVLLRIVPVAAHDPNAIVKALRSLDAASLDGIALMVPETPQVRDSIARIKQSGLAVVALASDLPNSPRDFFVGIDNVKAGRTAALLMGKFLRREGEILVVTNSIRSRDSLERRLGFDAVMQHDFPNLTVLPTMESFDDRERMEEIVFGQLIRRHKLVGIYSMGSGNQFVLNALRRSARAAQVSTIVHELTPPTRRGLVSGEIDAVISQNAGHLVRGALRVLRSLSDGVPIYEAQDRIRIDVVLRENIP